MWWIVFSVLVANANEAARSTKICRVDDATSQRFREHLLTVKKDCADPKLAKHPLPSLTDAAAISTKNKGFSAVHANAQATLDDLERQNSIYEDKIAKCMGHRFTLHETRRELNREHPPSCSGYFHLIEESKRLEKNISNMVLAAEAHIKWNIEVARRHHKLLDVASSYADKQRSPASLPPPEKPKPIAPYTSRHP